MQRGVKTNNKIEANVSNGVLTARTILKFCLIEKQSENQNQGVQSCKGKFYIEESHTGNKITKNG